MSIPTGIDSFDDYVYGTRRGCYYLYGAETGVGKTTFVREAHMHTVYDYYKAVNDPSKFAFQFVDFSLEIQREINMASAMSRRLYLKHGKVLTVEQLMGWNKKKHGILSEEAINLIEKEWPYFEEYEQNMYIEEEEVTPETFHDHLMRVAKGNGTFMKEAPLIANCGDYIPNNPNLYTIVFIDTVNLVDLEPGTSVVKSSIDKISRTAVWFRNRCNFTIVMVQQFNSNNSDMDRKRFGVPTPQLRDFEDSKRTTKDANIVFGLYDPSRHPSDEPIAGYTKEDFVAMRGSFRSLHLLKNRNGLSNKIIPLKFNGMTGTFKQLPPAILGLSNE